MNIQCKPIQGYEDYLIYEDGRVYSNKSNKFKKSFIAGAGYFYNQLSNKGKIKNKSVARLVATHFIPTIEGKTQVNHKDGNKLNNDISNLEWCNSSENQKHAFSLGLNNSKGIKNGRAKLTEPMVIIIKKLLSEEELSQAQIGSIFNVSRSTIRAIKLKESWSEV